MSKRKLRPRTETEAERLDRYTTEIARQHGCDRAVFTVCWGEYEQGLVCRCKEDAKARIADEDGNMVKP